TATPPPTVRRREAIAGHLAWMMQFLHDHHTTEDESLYPLVRQRNPGAAALFDGMHADHQSIAPAIAAFEARAEDYGRGDDADQRDRLLAALDALGGAPPPH